MAYLRRRPSQDREAARRPQPRRGLEDPRPPSQPHLPRLPVVLTRSEARSVLAQLEGVPLLVASLLYGSGLRLLEAQRLRVKDLDMASGAIVVRHGRG
jgi:integrase